MTCHPAVLQGRYIHEATKRIPIIGDGDTGYGNAMNVKRTVKGYAAAGFAGDWGTGGGGAGWVVGWQSSLHSSEVCRSGRQRHLN
jgi:hypothetical protein